MGQRTRRVALVTDGDQRAALAVVRSLGASAFRVIVAAARKHTIAGASRFAARRIVTPSALDNPEGFIAAIQEVAQEEGIDLLLPITDASLLSVLGARPRFPGVAIPFAELEQFRRISDKALLLETARAIGIAVPEQVVVESPSSDLDGLIATLRYPVVVKPAR